MSYQRTASRLSQVVRRQTPAFIEDLEQRRLLAAPVLEAIAAQTVPANGTLQIPLRSSDTDGDALSYSVSSNSGNVVATLHSTSNTYLKMSVAGKGDMIFQLFNDVAPETIRQLTGLINAGYYNGLTFHRVIANFVIQGGDKAGTGAGPSPIRFNDEFNANTIFSSDGQLAMANSGKDTNGTQFFITKGEQRHLDFNHTIFGQLIRGFDVRDAIRNVPVGANDKPTTPVVISSMSIVQNKTDQVLQVKVTGTNSGTVTVTVNDGHGGTNQKTFTATGSSAGTLGTNEPPILLPVGNRIVAKNATITLNLTALDPEGDDYLASGEFVLQNGASGSVNGKTITITPKKDFTGTIIVTVGVATVNSNSRGSTVFTPNTNDDYFKIFDKETITIAVGDKAVSGEGRNVDAAAGALTPGMIVATFTDSDPAGAVADWTASIQWGDGSNATTGTIVKNSDGTFSVLGSHSYVAVGNFPLTVVITGNKGATTTETGVTTARDIIALVGGDLVINASSAGDALAITRQSDGKIHVNLNGTDKKVTASAVNHLTITGYAGDDSISIGSNITVPTYVLAGDGNDNVLGGGGKDNVVGGAGKNTLNGGDGEDRVVGSGGRDNLQGGAGNDRLYGGAGSDTMSGGLGVDRLYGGDGDDQLFGDQSNDKLYGEKDNDQLFGGKGTDLMDGGPGTDTAFKDTGETPTNCESVLG